MANIHTLFEQLVEIEVGQHLAVGVVDRNDYETVRTALVKYWNKHKEIIRSIADDDPFLDNSLCGNYDGDTSSAEFWLGKPRRKEPRQYTFSIVPKVTDNGTSS